jgi:hypothetical protein
VMQIPSVNSTHVAQDPVTVVATVIRFVSEAWLVALYPRICIGPVKMPVKSPQSLNKSVSP